MAPSGFSGFGSPVLHTTLMLLIISTFSSSQATIYRNSTIGESAFHKSKLTHSVKDAILNEIFEYNFGTTTFGGVMFDQEKYALLLAIIRHDLHRFAHYSCDVDCAARWLQLGGGIYDRVITCKNAYELELINCTYYAFPLKEYGDLAILQLDHHYSARPRSCSWADFYFEINELTYAQVVAKWAKAMQQVEQYRVRGGSGLCYNIPTEFAYARRVELLVTILSAFRQTLEVGWYYEHFTLATFLKPFCGPKALPHSNQYSFHHFVWSLTKAVPFATNESIRSYVSSICPTYGTLFPVKLAADLHEIVPDYYQYVGMPLPDVMHRCVSYVMTENIQLFVHKEDDRQKVIRVGDSLEWMQQDFLMFHLGKDYGAYHSDSIDRSITRKFIFHLSVCLMAEKFHEKAMKKANEAAKIYFGLSRLHGYIIVGIVCIIQLVVGVWIYSHHYSTNSKKANRQKPKKNYPKRKFLRF